VKSDLDDGERREDLSHHFSVSGKEPGTSLKGLKARARELLPEGSACRALILSQPDTIPEDEGVPLARVLSRLLSDELG